jgi:MFS family permease
MLAREHTIAPPGYSRWLVPPAALAVHLSIGQAYALSVFNLPLANELHVPLTATIWMFNIAFFFLGVSAALFGTWVERVGPRMAMLASATCFSSGFFVSALAVKLKVLLLFYAGYGVLGGIGLGLGYISPVSTLIKWFPDRPGMATGLAIMGFGGGAMVGAPLAVTLMDGIGLAGTFVAMGAIYLALMLFGAAIVRLPSSAAHATTGAAGVEGMTAREAIRTPAFWLVWGVLFTNVTAGIGILGQASPMIQEMFKQTPAAAAGFVGLLSLFNLVGRFGWSSFSDRLGRKRTYAVYLALGALLYAAIPSIRQTWIFVAVACVILSMYGGGFATVPAYLRDLFGTKQVGAIHGRLLTAWSTAALVGPTVVTYAREWQLERGVAKSDAYSKTMYFLAALLVVGFVCNARIRVGRTTSTTASAKVDDVRPPLVPLLPYWIVVLIPLSWGVYQVVKKSIALFT